MSVSGYFTKRGSLRMPRVEEGVADKNGFRFYGDVLTGKLSVEEALRPDRMRGQQDSMSNFDESVRKWVRDHLHELPTGR